MVKKKSTNKNEKKAEHTERKTKEHKKEKRSRTSETVSNTNYTYIAIIVVLTALLIFTFIYKSEQPTTTNVQKISPEEAKENAVNLIQELVAANNPALKNVSIEVESIKEVNGIYEMNYSVMGQKAPPLYISLDGKYIYPQRIPTDFKLPQASNQQQQNTQEIPKSDKPKVELFVMSYCPYGTQMEKAYIPVMRLLGDKADMSVKFVNYAMHGEKETEENLRQYCIETEQNDKYIDYLTCFIENSGDYEKCLNDNNIDKTALESCMNEVDEQYKITGNYPKFPIYDDLNKKYGVQGSPTLVINGQKVQVARSPEAVKEAVCNAFNNPPEECNTKLSEDQEKPMWGKLGEQGGSTPAASCG